MGRTDPAIRPPVSRYFRIQGDLHGLCFYLVFCDPEDETVREIRSAEQFIQDAEAMAG